MLQKEELIIMVRMILYLNTTEYVILLLDYADVPP